MTSRLQMSSAFNPQPCASGDRMGRGLSPHSALGAVTAWIPAAARGFTASSAATSVIVRSRLFRKYVGLFVAVVCLALLTNGLFEIWFSYRDHKAALIRIQHEQAEAAAGKIGQFIKEIESQIGWTTSLPWSASTLEQRRFDALRLLRQVPAITEARAARSHGQRAVARFAACSGRDRQRRRLFQGSQVHRSRGEQGLLRAGLLPPRVRTLYDARAGRHPSRRRRERRRGQSQVHLGCGVADQGRRARPRLRGRRARPPHRASRHQPGAAQHRPVRSCPGAGGPRRRWIDAAPTRCRTPRTFKASEVLTAYAPVPLARLAGIRRAAGRRGLCAALRLDRAHRSLLLLAALGLAFLAGLFLARRMVVPIQALRAGAPASAAATSASASRSRPATSSKRSPISSTTWRASCRKSYADLERKVEDRTRELAQSVRELRALGEVSQAVNSTLDLETVLDDHRRQGGAAVGDRRRRDLCLRRGRDESFTLRATYGMERGADRGIQGAAHRVSTTPCLAASDRATRAGADRRPAREVATRGLSDRPARRLPRAADRAAAAAGPHRRRARRAPPRAGRISQADGRPAARPSPRSRCWRSRTRACSARSRKRAASSRSRASTSRSSSPT